MNNEMSVDDNQQQLQNQLSAKRRKISMEIHTQQTQQNFYSNQNPYENILTTLLILIKKIDKLEAKLNEIDGKIIEKEKQIKEEFSYIS